MILPKLQRMIAPSGRGSVVLIATLLLSSATIRILTSTTSAFAQSSQLPTAPMPAKTPTDQTVEDEGHGNELPQISRQSAERFSNRSEISALIDALSEREKQVTDREKQLEMRLRALSVADAEIEKRLLSLTKAEEDLRATLSLADKASEKDILRLTSVYESMKPKNAAALFEEMEPNFAAGFLARMRPDAAAQVMAGLSPPVAYSISVILAGRNATVPKT